MLPNKGDVFKVRKYKDLIQECPDEDWNKGFFEKYQNKTVRVVEIIHRREIVLFDKSTGDTIHIDTHVGEDKAIVPLSTIIEINENLFEI